MAMEYLGSDASPGEETYNNSSNVVNISFLNMAFTSQYPKAKRDIKF